MGDLGEWGWQTDLRLSRKKHTHQYGCVDPFCPGCFWRGPKNSSECKTTNVRITNEKYYGSFEGVTDDGDSIWIHRKYEKEIKNILPPGIDVIGKTFGITFMRNFETILKTPRTPFRCIKIHKRSYGKGVTIIHPKSSLPFSKGTMIQIPL